MSHHVLRVLTVAIALGEAFGFGGVLSPPRVMKEIAPLMSSTATCSYSIGSHDLSQKWMELVSNGKVEAETEIDEAPIGSVRVRYGVRLVARGGTERCEDFVEQVSPSSPKSIRVQEIHQSLKDIQDASSTSAAAVQFVQNGSFVGQLQLIRTLRPAPSAGFSEATSNIPPKYIEEHDSFVNGPLRLELRPLVARLDLDSPTAQLLSTPWDVYHNVSPCDTRGHFLLLPTLSDKQKNWRGQVLTPSDCKDVVRLVGSISPPGSLFVAYNSVGAGASQNHIHLHASPCPPACLLDHDGPAWTSYPVSQVSSLYDFADFFDGKVEVSYLDYPVMCVQLSATEAHLDLLGKSLASVLELIGDAPYNVGFLNRKQPIEEDENDSVIAVDVFLFVRSRERSPLFPSLKMGASEMMGVFHAQTVDQLEEMRGELTQEYDYEVETEGGESALNDNESLYRALQDISYTRPDELWQKIKCISE